MGRKRLSKWYPIVFHFTISLMVIFFLSGCQGDRFQISFTKPIYEADFRHIEQILNYADQGKFEASLAENEKFERRYDDSVNSSPDYSRVIVSFVRMNTILLKRVIQDESNLSQQSKKIEQLNLMNKEFKIKMDELTRKLKGMKIALKTVEHLKIENKALRQQIEDFKKIDLQSDKIDDVM
jgi:DNA repair ATPase RecN